ncbi:metallophosphatase [Flavobacteriales bacterium]|nr:metallophosphatase [Flavobacteriales bacterium]
MNRAHFIKSIGIAGTGVILSPETLLAKGLKKETVKLTILHTNDMHSHIDPFPSNDPKYPNLGGIVRRSTLINEIRAKEENVLLLDAGDVFQGTPYFNLYGGELEFKLMSKMGYDACTIGNHDLDNGLTGLKSMLPHADFPFLNCNYDFSNTILDGSIIPHKVFNKGSVKIGVFGIGVELEGLVDPKNYLETGYLDPIEMANEKADFLKNKEGCHLVICLSHLGHRYESKKVSDLVLGKTSKNIDLIIGGHTHTFLDRPVSIKNKLNHQTLITQAGWAGIKLGRIDYTIHLKSNDNHNTTMSYTI